MLQTTYREISWEGIIGAVEKVRERLRKAAAALDAAAIPYAEMPWQRGFPESMRRGSEYAGRGPAFAPVGF